MNREPHTREAIIIVSGLPRSGTSMMMKMLEAGGRLPLTDELRTADEDNPKGYYEFEPVKDLANNFAWLDAAHGKTVKVISALLKHLPATHNYQIVFMRRNMDEILASQRQMLIRRGEAVDKVPDGVLAEMFAKHIAATESWIAAQQNICCLYVNYNEMLTAPAEPVRRVNEFLGGSLDTEAMRTIVDPTLYRRKTGVS